MIAAVNILKVGFTLTLSPWPRPQAAHIGCGISGREGRAAVMASDYSFAQASRVPPRTSGCMHNTDPNLCLPVLTPRAASLSPPPCSRAPQFKYVARLILLHGRAAYKRNAEVVWYAFYKNWIYNMVLMYFGFLTGKLAGYAVCLQ